MGWAPLLMLWLGLVAGAVTGALAYGRFGMRALAGAVIAMAALTAFMLPRGRIKASGNDAEGVRARTGD